MPAPKAILDASAIVALVRREQGCDTVRKIIEAGVAAATPTGLAEALITCHRRGYDGTRSELASDLKELGLRIEPLTEEDAEEIAYLLERSDALGAKGGRDAAKLGSLSLGDAACLAVAQRLDASAVVSDGTWELLEVRGLRVLPFR